MLGVYQEYLSNIDSNAEEAVVLPFVDVVPPSAVFEELSSNKTRHDVEHNAGELSCCNWARNQ